MTIFNPPVSITVEELLAIKTRLKEINDLDLDDIILTKNGIEIPIDQETKDEWMFIGLTNVWLLTAIAEES